MTDSEFLARAESVLATIEREVERVAEGADVDVECSRNGNVLEIELIEAGSKIIVNSQAAMQEIWVASRSGGFHYRHEAGAAEATGRWRDTRNGTELFKALSDALTEQSGETLRLEPPLE
ncbi:MAG TPA: iron donor protein CyaY [Noviherbaspirillum sp.]